MIDKTRREVLGIGLSGLVAAALSGLPRESEAKSRSQVQIKVDKWTKQASPYRLAQQAASLARKYGKHKLEANYDNLKFHTWRLRATIDNSRDYWRFIEATYQLNERNPDPNKNGKVRFFLQDKVLSAYRDKRILSTFREDYRNGKINPQHGDFSNFGEKSSLSCLPPGLFGDKGLGVEVKDGVLYCTDKDIDNFYQDRLTNFFTHLASKYQRRIEFKKL